MDKLKILFSPRPEKWGLRGDEVLWGVLEQRLSNEDMPESVEHLVEILDSAFRRETSFSLALIDTIHDKRFSSGGMSSGVICGDYWRNVAFPLLLQRYCDRIGRKHPTIHNEESYAIFKF